MQTFTIVDGQAYPGTFNREVVQLANLQFVRRSYLSAHGTFGSIHVEKMDGLDEEPIAESVMREALAEAIRKRLVH